MKVNISAKWSDFNITTTTTTTTTTPYNIKGREKEEPLRGRRREK